MILAAAKKADKQKGKQDTGKGKHCIIDPHQHFIQDAAIISGQRPDQNTESDTDQYSHDQSRSAPGEYP